MVLPSIVLILSRKAAGLPILCHDFSPFPSMPLQLLLLGGNLLQQILTLALPTFLYSHFVNSSIVPDNWSVLGIEVLKGLSHKFVAYLQLDLSDDILAMMILMSAAHDECKGEQV